MSSSRKSAIALTKDSTTQRRKDDRKRVFLPGRIETERGGFECRVLNLSGTGAKVASLRPLQQDEKVTLLIGRVDTFEAIVVWKEGNNAGLHFLSHTKREAKSGVAKSNTSPSDTVEGADRPASVVDLRGEPLGEATVESNIEEPVDPPSAHPLPKEPPSHSASDQLPTPATPANQTETASGASVSTRKTETAPSKSERSREENERVGAIVVQLQAYIMERIDPQRATRADRAELTRAVETLVVEAIDEKGVQVNQRERLAVIERIIDEMSGLGPLEPLLADETVNDILVNGPKKVYVERGGRLSLTSCVFADHQHVMNIANRIVTQVGRRIDETTPLVDARLPDGSRVNVIVPPLSIDGPMISIRKFAKKEITFEIMVAQGNMSEAMATVLKIAARSRLNVLISGGTGSGKTTLLNAMSQMIDPAERVITIEDAAELQLQQPHVGRLETRPANLEGKGEITIRDLFKNALRMRPDRIIVGEIRGSEAFDMLQAMNSGHDGSLGTIHASGPREALTRLENIITVTGMNFSPRAARVQIASAIDMVVQISRMRDGKRRVVSIMEVVGMEGEVITTQELFQYRTTGETSDGDLIGDFVATGLRPHFMPAAEYHGLGRELVKAMQ